MKWMTASLTASLMRLAIASIYIYIYTARNKDSGTNARHGQQKK